MFLDAKLPHVLSRQAWQHRVVNVFLAESRLVLLAAQDPRPARGPCALYALPDLTWAASEAQSVKLDHTTNAQPPTVF